MKRRKSVCFRGSAPNPAGELTTHPRPPYRLRRGTTPPQTPSPQRLRRLAARCLWHLDRPFYQQLKPALPNILHDAPGQRYF